MFDQQLYDQEAPELRLQPGDPFYKYEIKNWEFTPRLYKILTISAVANILALVVIGSSGMLTTRGCDSPFVGRVCQVLDTVYVGSLIFGTESEYADVDYTPTELENAEIVWIDQTGVTPPLTYPAGYFQLANPEQYVANVTDPMAATPPGYLAPGIPSNPAFGGGGLLNTPPVALPSNPNPLEGDVPSGTGGENSNQMTSKGRSRRPGTGPLSGSAGNSNANTDPTANANVDPNNPTVAQNPDELKEEFGGVFINKRPMKDRAKDSLEKIEAQAVKTDTPFKVVISSTLGPGKDGKTVVLKNPKPVPLDPPYKNDPVMEKFVQDWILAVGDAGWFGYLTRIDPKPKNLVITVEQNDTELIASVKADQPTAEQANTQASSLTLLLSGALQFAKGDDLAFLQKASVKPDGKAFVLNFSIPKPQAQEMIQRKLADFKEKESKPNGNAAMKPGDNTAER